MGSVGRNTDRSWLGRIGRNRLVQTLVRWVDDEAVDESYTARTTDRPDWFRVLPFLVLHLACLGVIWVGWSWTAVAVAAALYVVRMFAITAFYHRYFSHRTFRTSRFWQFLFALLGTSAVQRGPLWWAAHHRHHHKCADKEDDVHSPLEKGFLWSHVTWLTTPAAFRTRHALVKDLAAYPELRFLNRFSVLAPVLLAAALFGAGELLRGFVPAAGTSGPQLLIWGFFISTVVLFHATSTINSLDHLVGRRRYATADNSRNNLLLALLTFGEGWHNNHHHYAASARQGFFWWEVDLTYYGLWLMARLGIVRDLRRVPARVLTSNLVSDGASRRPGA